MTQETSAAGHQDVRILHGDCIEQMRALPSSCVQTCVTSPPYFGLRSYDEESLRIDPNLDPATRAWLEAELQRRGIHAR